ncbi:hypothetical protein KFK09_027561 [Dendrobium nobile]|uniref:Uncharacterized protein n=1 Tax=Dendrobium nobile TaxID=94219 RepID=A0A8T3AGC1_DENNO|nr:hypothetical protein KFK09_027561 [Dendrobium nobile]
MYYDSFINTKNKNIIDKMNMQNTRSLCRVIHHNRISTFFSIKDKICYITSIVYNHQKRFLVAF